MNFKRFHESKNLFDKNSAPSVGWYCGSDDIIRSSTAIKATYIPCSPNTTYTIAKVQSARFKVAWTANEPALGVTYYGLTNVSGTSATVTTGSTASYLYIEYYTSASDTYTEAEIRNTIMLNLGSTPLPYEPYSSEVWHDIPHYIHNTSTDTLTTLPAVLYLNDTTATVGLKGNMQQSGTPTSTTPIQPQETGERTGNLCEKVEAPLSQYRIYIENFKSIIDNYSTFTLIFNTQLSYSGNTLYLYTGSNTTLGYITGTGTITKTFNLNAENKEAIKNATNPYIFVYVNNVDQSSNTNAMLVSGSTPPSSFIPYGIKIPISSGGVTTPVYLGEVQTTRIISKYEFTGQEEWARTTSNVFRTGISGYLRQSDNTPVCTHYKGQSTVSATSELEDFACAFLLSSSGNNYFYIRDLNFDAYADFKAYLAQQYAAGTPVCVWYVLATETTGIVNEPLRKIGDYADSVSGITIPTIAGANTLSVDTTLQPSEVTATYKGWHPVQSVHERESGAWT